MDRTRASIRALALCIAVAGTAAACAAPQEGRALYVTRWHMTSADEIAQAVQYALDQRFNMLFCQVFGNAEALYDSAAAPRSHLVSPGFDALAEAVAQGHAAGLEVHAYMNTVCVWSGNLGLPANPAHIVNAHPEWSMENAAGVRDVDLAATEGAMPFFCPREPAFVQFLVSVAEEIVSSYDVDGVHLDYIRYPTDQHCFCARHRNAFFARHGRYPTPGEALFSRFCEEDVTALVAAIHTAIKAVRPTCRLSAALISPTNRKGQAAQHWLEAGILDIAVPMLYTDNPAVFQSALTWFRLHSGGRHLMPAIGVGYQQVGSQIDIARDVGAAGFAIFQSNQITPGVTAEIAARLGAAADPPSCHWLDGTPDTIPPVISAVRADGIGAEEATIIWHTDEQTRGTVQYGTTPAYGSESQAGDLRFDHAVTLRGLSANTFYHFRVRAVDAAGNAAVSGGAAFTTLDKGPPEVIVNDSDAEAAFFGTWNVGTFGGGYGGDYRWTMGQPSITARAEYRPFLPRAGEWEVSITYTPGTNRTSAASYSVVHAGGTDSFLVDQRVRAEEWIILGMFEFDEGWGAAVLQTNLAASGEVVVADAARWSYAGAPANPPFIRGDANGDGQVNLADAITILAYLFAGAQVTACLDALDVGDTGKIDIAAAIYLLSYLFAGGPPPMPPFPEPGHDPMPNDPYLCGD